MASDQRCDGAAAPQRRNLIKWLTFWGFCLGLIESFLYGAYAGLVFVPLYNFLARRWGGPVGGQSRPA